MYKFSFGNENYDKLHFSSVTKYFTVKRQMDKSTDYDFNENSVATDCMHTWLVTSLGPLLDIFTQAQSEVT